MLAPAVEWLDYLNSVLSPLELNDTEPVVVYAKEYMQQVSELINKTDRRYGFLYGFNYRVQEEDVPSESVCLDCVSEHSVLITVSLSRSLSHSSASPSKNINAFIPS